MYDLDWLKREVWPAAPRRPVGRISLVDVFCGCGGLTLGAWEAARRNNVQLEIKLALDSSEDALTIFQDNFRVSEHALACADITRIFSGRLTASLNVEERRWRRRIGDVDILVAGPPCQGHSDLNNHTRRHDRRNSLYARAVRAIRVLMPHAAIIENVPAVVHDQGHVIARARNALHRWGYATSEASVNAVNIGVPQRRVRHLLVATRGDSSFSLSDCLANSKSAAPLAVSSVLAGLEDEPDYNSNIFGSPSRMAEQNSKRVAFLFSEDAYDLPDRLRPRCHRLKRHSYRSMYGRMRWDKPAQTITSGFGSMGQGRFVHPTRPRTITPHEAARIQGIPDFFRWGSVATRGALQEMIGNAVIPRVSGLVIDGLLKQGLLDVR